ncbi:FAD-dependent monooxygenase [Mycobacterium sp. HUMS_1102779]|uniref:FAD-dependent monooxygenase n=1 Tax=Mycobacterium sp. HUMS_1102779 TaxID=3383487 RepID=UPI00389A5223
MVLGLLLARAGVDVTVMEKHADFLRDFRGGTVHASTLPAPCGYSTNWDWGRGSPRYRTASSTPSTWRSRTNRSIST